jgi:hypothetical protein
MTPDEIELRKRTGLETPSEAAPLQMRKELFTVLEQKEARVGSGMLYGSAYTYNLSSTSSASASSSDESDRPDFVKSQMAAAAAADAVTFLS